MNRGNFGCLALIGIISGAITIFAFVSGRSSLKEALNWLSTPSHDTNLGAQNDHPAESSQISDSQNHSELSPEKLNEVLATVAQTNNLDQDLLACVMDVEGRADADEARRVGSNLNALMVRYHDNLALALAAYKSGPEAVDKYHGIPPDQQTREFVSSVIHGFNIRVLRRRGAQQKQQSVDSVTDP